VYAITPRGRRALGAWLGADSAEPVFESEHILKAFYAENGLTADLLATLDHLRGWVHGLTLRNVEVGGIYVDGDGQYLERLAVLGLTGRFLDDYLEMIDRWAMWAEGVVAEWPPDPRDAVPDIAGLRATVRQAKARAARWNSAPPHTPRPPDGSGADPYRFLADEGPGMIAGEGRERVGVSPGERAHRTRGRGLGALP